jgi:hypothetical protein
MDCYNYGELSHLAHQCPKPKKDKYKNKYTSKKDDSSDDDDDEKKKNKPYNKMDGKKKEYKKKNNKAYIVGDWLIDIESLSGSSDGESECGSPINNRKSPKRKIDDQTRPVGADRTQVRVRLV